MGELGDTLIRPVILLVVHIRLACGGEQAVVWPVVSLRQAYPSQREGTLCSPDDTTE